MIGAVIVAHGRLAQELMHTAEMIVGPLSQIKPVSIDVNDEVNSARERIRKAIKGVDNGSGVIIFTDMFGGTPSNISLSFLDELKVEVVTGINLPMLLKMVTTSEEPTSLRDFANILKKKGQESIHVASEFLHR
jgi:PTS system mannose-specific IIA component